MSFDLLRRRKARLSWRPIAESLEVRALLSGTIAHVWTFGHSDLSRSGSPSGEVSILAKTQKTTAPPAAGLDLSRYVTASLSGFSTRRGKATQTITVKLVNKTNATISGPLVIWLKGLPASVSIDGLSRRTAAGSPYVVVTDLGLGAKKSHAFKITLRNPTSAALMTPKAHAFSQAIAPGLLDPNALTVAGYPLATTEKAALQGAVVATFTDTANPHPSAGEYTATIGWGDGSITSGSLAADAVNPSRFFVTGNHVYTHPGVDVISIIISGPGGVSAGSTTVATITAVADVPLTSQGSDIPILRSGIASTGLEVARFTDPSGGAKSEFSATIDWGDGTKSAGLIVTATSTDPGTTYAVTGDHTYSANGSYKVSTTIQETSASTTTATTTAQVGVSLEVFPVTTTEGAMAGKMAIVHTGNPTLRASDLAVTIDWGDLSPRSTTPSGDITVVAIDKLGDFEIDGLHVYTPSARLQAKITVGWPQGQTLAETTSVIVQDGMLVVVPPNDYGPQKATGGQPVESEITTFFDPDPNSSLFDYIVTIDWGDGSPTTTDTMIRDVTQQGAAGKTYLILGDGHVYPEVPRIYSASITVQDIRGDGSLFPSTVTETFLVSVTQ